MRSLRALGLIAAVVAASGVYLGVRAEAPAEEWATRTVYACDQRKVVIVEGVSASEKLSPAKAQQVADLLTDLMRYCNAEVKARIAPNQLITLSINGLPYEQYVPGSEPPIELVRGKSDYGDRDRAIWKAELDKLVKEGDRLFHSDEIGSNGIACAMCHPNASNTHPETYPKYQIEMKKLALLRDMVNWCIENPLEGKKLADDDPKLRALEAYILVQRKGAALDAGKH